MEVKLINEPTLEFVDLAIGKCYDMGAYFPDEDKACIRINKVTNVYKHSSVLEFAEYVFEITASTKVLLEMTRHRIASYACKSSRYTLDRGEVVFEATGDPEIDYELSKWKVTIEKMIKDGKKNDVVSLMLPQAYQYKWVMKINARALHNFFELRLSRTAHSHIRDIANDMWELIPKEHKFLFAQNHQR